MSDYDAGFTAGAMGCAAVMDERDRWIRLFNRLDAAINHHKKDKRDPFIDEVDEALYSARDKILRDAATTP